MEGKGTVSHSGRSLIFGKPSFCTLILQTQLTTRGAIPLTSWRDG